MSLGDSASILFERHAQALLGSLGRLARQPFAAFLTILVIGIALALPAALYLAVANMRVATAGLDDTVQLSAYLELPTTPAEARALSTRIARMTGVGATEVVSPEEGLAEFRQRSGVGDALQALGENPLPWLVKIRPAPSHDSAPAVEAMAAEIRGLDGVDFVEADTAWVRRLHALEDTLQQLVLVVGALLAIGVLGVVGNTIRLEIDGRDRVGKDGRVEPETDRVEARRLDAVVGRQAGDDDPLDRSLAEEPLELCRDLLARVRVAHREARVAVLAVRALEDRRPDDLQARMELGAPAAGDAMDRPDAAVLREVGRRWRVPVLGVRDERARREGCAGRRVDDGDDPLRAADAERALRVREVVLDVDEQQRGLAIEGDVTAGALLGRVGHRAEPTAARPGGRIRPGPSGGPAAVSRPPSIAPRPSRNPAVAGSRRSRPRIMVYAWRP